MYVDESTQRASVGGSFEIGVREHDGAGFAAEFHQHGFEVPARGGGDHTAHGRAAGVVDFLDGWVLDQGGGDGCGVLGAVGEDVEAAGGEAGLGEDGADGPEAAGGELGPFEHGGVAAGEGVGHGPDAEDVGSVPGGWS